ncbi:ATP synthase F0 subcomplex subunit OSCP atp5 [Tilletia horrida]|uniref:ATP synthase subunit 5, mitochondrial n=1 Tax=Tilletia horrida TaxID=155126 RepID=A0AAN6GVS5_9BASI|nr:ATP synthase F0 subcomplex subunit OSCP atp5 [Tilletia horrida]KAK0558024.1 ATP synthase F0 subcomplex subunit OSCP atp5 [Tilletia horrida]KAK0569160.1 ATP synthase F0 subcomplex subunit OSCP atp5 [Tilletia horrida]
MLAQRFAQAARGYATQAPIKVPIQLNGLPGKYATAAYTAALRKDSKTLSKVESDVKAIQATLAGSDGAKFSAFLNNPTLAAKEKVAGIEQLLGNKDAKPDAVTKNLFTVLAENGRLSDTPKVLEGFLELMSAHRGEVTVTITTATPLDKSATQRLESALKNSQIAAKNGGKTLNFVTKVNPAIQGGLVVDFGDSTVDLSVSSRVNQLNALLQESV